MTTRRLLSPDDLVDPVTGIVRSVREVLRPPGAPERYVSLTASVADARRLGDWPADRVSLGTSFGDPATARIAAIAEAVERYCGNWIPPEPGAHHRITTAAALRGAGENTLDEFPRFAAWQLERPGFPYRDVTDDTETLWVRCSDESRAGDTAPIWAPASLVLLNWRRSWLRELPRLHHLNYAGIATGQGVADARDRGILEVIERDALETWWHLDGPTHGIDLDSVPGLREDLAGGRLDAHAVTMPSEFAPCVAALVRDPDTGIRAAGFASSLSPERAVRKAVLEAIHTWAFTLGVLEPGGWVFRAVDAGLSAPGLYLGHRADGRYLDSAGAHFENVVDLGAHVQVWLDERTHREERRFTEPALGERAIGTVAATTMPEVRRRLAARGHRVITCDLTTRDIARTPLRVVRSLVTGLVPNAPAAFTYYGCPRFGEVAVARGWRTSVPSGPDDLSLLPAPHM
ncbi:YcaO-like family protein [Rhodococcus rhodnii]|uniref:YcaO-like family protein n=1 Tax=Rhodococcus rhodnii TaxID=38312 RepID=UPI0003AA9D8E|nr:YcaO-like family protein [Rhodococcus rhodnii]